MRRWSVLILCLAVGGCGHSSSAMNDGGGGGGGGGDGGSGGGGTLTGSSCPIFPADNAWNTDISTAEVDPNSDAYIASIGAGTGMHPDFDAIGDGIPWTTVPGTQALVPVTFQYASESDPGPYPIPDNAPVEKGSDHHVIVIDKDNCKLYEMWDSTKTSSGWMAGSGAKWDLTSDAGRPEGWTSADAAGLPIFPGLVRYDEVFGKGEIDHALRFTVAKTQAGYVAPASHFASSDTNPNLPPMGLRLRLKASVDISGYPAPVQVILKALKKYGMIVADNGSNWYISGEPNAMWPDDTMAKIRGIVGSDFEVVKHGPIGTMQGP